MTASRSQTPGGRRSICSKERMGQARNPIVLLDINLPDLSGDIIAKKILAMNTAAKIIPVTAEDRNEVR
jgi:DNA-binding response OmpR family regulator